MKSTPDGGIPRFAVVRITRVVTRRRSSVFTHWSHKLPVARPTQRRFSEGAAGSAHLYMVLSVGESAIMAFNGPFMRPPSSSGLATSPLVRPLEQSARNRVVESVVPTSTPIDMSPSRCEIRPGHRWSRWLTSGLRRVTTVPAADGSANTCSPGSSTVWSGNPHVGRSKSRSFPPSRACRRHG